MAYIIAEPCIGVKDTACVDACPVDCIHPKKNTTYEDGRPRFEDYAELNASYVEGGKFKQEEYAKHQAAK